MIESGKNISTKSTSEGNAQTIGQRIFRRGFISSFDVARTPQQIVFLKFDDARER